VIVLKNSIKMYIKIALAHFGAITSSLGSTLFGLAKVALVNMANYGRTVFDYIDCFNKCNFSEHG